jgi:ABC-type uncharacterized transport system substrate-binding protein
VIAKRAYNAERLAEEILVRAKATSAREIEPAFEELKREKVGALIVAILGLLAFAVPLLALSHPVASRPVVIVVSVTAMLPDNAKAFVQGLHENGFNEGRDFDLDFRSADGDSGQVPAVARQAVALNPTVIVSQTTGLTVELKKATNSIPIVGNTITDPIDLGLIASYAHPGGNVTGTAAEASNPEKLLELLMQVAPGVTRIGNLANPTNPGNTVGFEKFASGAAKFSITSRRRFIRPLPIIQAIGVGRRVVPAARAERPLSVQ